MRIFACIRRNADMDPVVSQDESESRTTMVPEEETGPHTPQQMVIGRSLNVQRQDPDQIQGPISQDEQGPHLPEELIL